jgi:hypothetical protein
MDLLSALILSGCVASQANPQETFAESLPMLQAKKLSLLNLLLPKKRSLP